MRIARLISEKGIKVDFGETVDKGMKKCKYELEAVKIKTWG